MHNINHLVTCPDPGFAHLTHLRITFRGLLHVRSMMRCDTPRLSRSQKIPKSEARCLSPYSACLIPPFQLESVVGVYAPAAGVSTCVISK